MGTAALQLGKVSINCGGHPKKTADSYLWAHQNLTPAPTSFNAKLFTENGTQEKKLTKS